ncbi:TPA: hypothetical protein I9080_002124 [Clostridium perfringens]|uniref:Uncharacterized protein n=2 Tax=Clostridium perfringens TaxID=1502 RepID=A0A8H9UX66_CLOPF|nr:hypothetical protein [Clostridium perfringens]EDT15896.1 hypothetical protein AC3_A0208 [Clostridium perfringens E str. JGS1987]EGS5729020.1 hypothetical protein [Clostridium perfringens]EGT0013611.1 hypothetical protein [Clostridium perfringens]MCX0408592.1 hypothetical protein [Clostridium perfringens]MDU3020159.1 hypothetical protein [Clostridium perfringens]
MLGKNLEEDIQGIYIGNKVKNSQVILCNYIRSVTDNIDKFNFKIGTVGIGKEVNLKNKAIEINL